MDEFELLLARHGSAALDWPLDQRAAAEGLLRSSPAARKLLDDARTVDRLLQDMPPVKAPARLQGDILARVNAEIVRQSEASAGTTGSASILPSIWPSIWSRFWPQMVGFTAASLLGVMLGAQSFSSLSFSPLPNDMADASAYVLGYDGAALTLSMNEDQ